MAHAFSPGRTRRGHRAVLEQVPQTDEDDEEEEEEIVVEVDPEAEKRRWER